MAVSFKKLWHVLVDRNMKKKDLEEAAGITHCQMYKLANDKDITTDVIGAICAALEMGPNDIMDFVPEFRPLTHRISPRKPHQIFMITSSWTSSTMQQLPLIKSFFHTKSCGRLEQR